MLFRMIPLGSAAGAIAAVLAVVGPGLVHGADNEEMDRTARELIRASRELRELETAIRDQVEIDLPITSDRKRTEGIEIMRRELRRSADAINRLAREIDLRVRNSRSRTLTQADLASLNSSLTAVARQSNQWTRAADNRRSAVRDKGGSEIDIHKEAARNEARMMDTAFQQWLEKADELNHRLQEIMQTVADMQNTGAANSNW